MENQEQNFTKKQLRELRRQKKTEKRESEENKKIKGIGRPDFTAFKKHLKTGYVETKETDLFKKVKIK